MNKAFAILLSSALGLGIASAQSTGGDKKPAVKARAADAGSKDAAKAETKAAKKGHKGGMKSKKNSSGGGTTTPK
jgi:hypothetical protein